MAIAGAVSIAVLMAVYVAKLRRKETRFGYVGLLLLPSDGIKGVTGLRSQNQKLKLFLVH